MIYRRFLFRPCRARAVYQTFLKQTNAQQCPAHTFSSSCIPRQSPYCSRHGCQECGGTSRRRRGSPQDGCLSTPKLGHGLPLNYYQTYIQDSKFAVDFVTERGLVKLKALLGEATGNTLAYGLMAFAKILQVPDVRAEAFGLVDDWLIHRVLSSFSKLR
jgi:hypothetical protein